MLQKGSLAETAAALHSVPAFALQLTAHEREHSYEDQTLHIQEAFLGTTSLVLP
jgi:hypothetical protein